MKDKGEFAWKRNAFGKECDPVPNNGKWSREEALTLRNFIEESCAAEQVEPDSLLNDEHKKVKGLWLSVAKNFPNRPVNSVYRKGLRIIQQLTYTNGPWTELESSKLLELVTLHGKKWAKISKILGRSPDACADKYRISNKRYASGKWKDAEVETLKRILAEHYTDTDDIPWTAVSYRMGDRTRLSCMRKWQQLCETGEIVSDFNKGQSQKSKNTPKQSSRQQNIKLDPPGSVNKSEAAGKEIEEGSSETLMMVYKLMKNVLQKAPQKRMKQKSLRRAVKARYPKKKKELKKIMRAVIQRKESLMVDGEVIMLKE
mmetsp:Transcript_27593/g.41753  ORF Transcript_27593/g.41753 Transcript_27593/m.41753 type:complete len:315 (-) Transcript_27593:2720-3664(-)